MKIAAYLRVSTDRQAEEGLGLDVQQQAVLAWATEAGHRIVEWYRDEGVSGSNGLDTRVALPEALDAVRSGEARGLVVYRLDRLARDLVLQEQLLAELWRLGASVFSTSNAEAGYLSDDPDDPSRKLIRQVLGAVAEYERAMISLRLRSGRRRKQELGGYAYGAPPFGHRAVDRALLPDPEEQGTIRRAVQLRGEGQSLRQIAAVLEVEGRLPRRSRHWHPRTVAAVLTRADQPAA